MSFIFSSHQKVPSKTVKEIGEVILENFNLRLSTYPNLTHEMKNLMSTELNMAISQIVSENTASVDGIKLTSEQISEIANFLKAGKRVVAIRELRRHAGLGVARAKDFINKFPIGEAGCIQFLNAFGE